MEQQRQTETEEPRFDRTQAEAALLIAARLQQEHQDQFSLSDLKKTAAEVDIPPEFVEQAIRMVQKQEPTVATAREPGQLVAPIHISLGLVVVPAEFILVGLACAPRQLPMAWPLALALTGFLAWKLPKGSVVTRAGATYLVVGFIALLAFFAFMSVHRDFNEMLDAFGLLVLMAILQVSLYVWIRWIVNERPQPIGSATPTPSARSREL